MGFARLLQRKVAWMTGRMVPVSSMGHTSRRRWSAMAAFSATERGRNVEPVKVRRFTIDRQQIDVHAARLKEGDLHEAALKGEAGEIALHIGAAHHVQDDIHALSVGERLTSSTKSAAR